MRIMGLDPGERTIGVAVSDETASIATGLDSIRSVGPKKDVQAVSRIVRERGVEEIIVGLPRKLDGSLGPSAENALAFMERLKRSTGLPVIPWDERLTTVAANRALIEGNVRRRERKSVIDKVAAILILQSYLDYRSLTSASERQVAS
ncbi:MAG: Holliday junction resolvase RuvX [Vicinamibacteria bacterium]|nr:Holliday junction resolvase RuvX [Vicinamibacteria bacterium]